MHRIGPTEPVAPMPCTSDGPAARARSLFNASTRPGAGRHRTSCRVPARRSLPRHGIRCRCRSADATVPWDGWIRSWYS